MEPIICIDASYFIFYRLYALVNWWKLSHKDEPIDDLHENTEFVNKFKETFVKKLNELPKSLGFPKNTTLKTYVGKDCTRKDIWRMELLSSYKGTRGDYSDAKVKPGPFFKIVYDEDLFKKSSLNPTILYHPNLEADDCIAVTVKHLQTTKPSTMFYIITSDTDYLQLLNERVSAYNLRFRAINTDKNSLDCCKKDLLFKIITGDKSDNIEPLFNRNCKKLAKKFCEDPTEFNTLLESNSDLKDKFLLNKQLISFDEIPKNMAQHVISLLE